jgi:beta-lactamase class A
MILAALFFATLLSRIKAIAAQSDALVGVAVVDLESVRRISIHGDEHFPMASVVKFPVALSVLRRVDAGKLALDEAVHHQASSALPREGRCPGWPG